jgi:hypothetical protein
MDSIWTPVLGWALAAVGAAGLAVATPDEGSMLGKLPSLTAKRLDQTAIQLPDQLPSGRTLALVAFKGSQRGEVQSWIDGLRLHQEPRIAWLKLPVLNDPGDDKERRGIERRLLERHTTDADRARLVPLFTNRDAFVRAAGLADAEHASVLVLDRRGNVLARAQGPFHPHKAQALRETVLAQGD